MWKCRVVAVIFPRPGDGAGSVVRFAGNQAGRAVETPQAAYLRLLKPALRLTPDKSVLTAPMTGAQAVTYALQPITQAS